MVDYLEKNVYTLMSNYKGLQLIISTFKMTPDLN